MFLFSVVQINDSKQQIAIKDKQSEKCLVLSDKVYCIKHQFMYVMCNLALLYIYTIQTILL